MNVYFTRKKWQYCQKIRVAKDVVARKTLTLHGKSGSTDISRGSHLLLLVHLSYSIKWNVRKPQLLPV